MKICPQCHVSCADTDTFCPKCGALLPEKTDMAQQDYQKQESPNVKDAGKENNEKTSEKKAEVISVTAQDQEGQEQEEQYGEEQNQERQDWERPSWENQEQRGQERAASKGFFQMIKENIPNSKNWQEMYMSFDGRISRSQFFIRWLLVNIVAAVFVPLLAGIMPVYVVFFAITLFMQVSLCMRRFHDAGHGGIWVAVMLIPVVNIVAVVYLLFAKGEPRENEYGPQPQ